MAGDDPTIALFLVGLAVTIAGTALAQGGWKHKALITSLFVISGILFVAGIGWHWLKDLSPTTISVIVTKLATDPVSWFVVVMVGLCAVLFPGSRQPLLATRVPRAASPAAFVPPSPPAPPAIADIRVYVAFRDSLTKISFIPKLNFARLRIRLEWSQFAEGSIGLGALWTNPTAKVIADYHDLLNGVQQTIDLTEPREIYPIPAQPQRLLNWTKTDTPIPKGLYRVRISFIGDNIADTVYVFFLFAYLDENKNMAVAIIGEEQFKYLKIWESGIIVRPALAGC